VSDCDEQRAETVYIQMCITVSIGRDHKFLDDAELIGTLC